MHLNALTPHRPSLPPRAVHVEIWQGYLLRNNTGVTKTLLTYSLDNGPLGEDADGNFTFRFTLFDWEKTIRTLLARNNIHHLLRRTEKISALHQLLSRKIFLAEDDPDTSGALKAMLETAGYQVKAAHCGLPVIDGNFSYVDLFILDRKMPDIDGLELCRLLRMQEQTKDTPVILISALPNRRNEAALAGADEYLEKPFHMHYLLNTVSRLLKGRLNNN